jgi:hypothetical protein
MALYLKKVQSAQTQKGWWSPTLVYSFKRRTAHFIKGRAYLISLQACSYGDKVINRLMIID